MEYIKPIVRGEKKAADFTEWIKSLSEEDRDVLPFQARGAMLAVQALGYDSTELFEFLLLCGRLPRNGSTNAS
jgi:hypothetical protein